MNRFSPRDLIAVPAVFLLAHTPEITAFTATIGAGFLVKALGLSFWLGAPLMAGLGFLAAHLAVTELPGGRRCLGDVALDATDRIADWAEWGEAPETEVTR